jgi:tetratricopeptide (TPR) repeat protein
MFWRTLGAFVAGFICCFSSSAFAQEHALCGPPPSVDAIRELSESQKGDLKGRAEVLSKLLGTGELGGRIESERRSIYETSDAAIAARKFQSLLYFICLAGLTDKNASFQQKIDAYLELHRISTQQPRNEQEGAGTSSKDLQCGGDVLAKCNADLRNSPKLAVESCRKAVQCDSNSAIAHALLGRAERDNSQFQQAERSFHQLRSLGLKLGDRGIVAQSEYFLATVYQRQGALDRAEDLAKRILNFQASTQDMAGQGSNYKLLGDIALKRGNLPLAEKHFQDSITANVRSGDKIALVSGYQGMAETMLRKQNRTSACAHLQTAAKLAEETNFRIASDSVSRQRTRTNC